MMTEAEEWYEKHIQPECEAWTKIVNINDDWVYIYRLYREGKFFSADGFNDGNYYSRAGEMYSMVVELKTDTMDFTLGIPGTLFSREFSILRNDWNGKHPIEIGFEEIGRFDKIWIAVGDTYPVKEELKKLGMQWSTRAKLWYCDELPECCIPDITFRQLPKKVV